MAVGSGEHAVGPTPLRLSVLGERRRALRLSPPAGTAKDGQAPCIRVLWTRGPPHLKFSVVVTEQALLVWAEVGMVALEPARSGAGLAQALGKGPLRGGAPPTSRFPEGGREPQAGAPRSVGPGEAPRETRRRPDTGAALHPAVGLPHGRARPPAGMAGPAARARGPFVTHRRAPGLSQGPLPTPSHRRRALFFPSPRAWHRPAVSRGLALFVPLGALPGPCAASPPPPPASRSPGLSPLRGRPPPAPGNRSLEAPTGFAAP